jgi:hypothetical protein
MFYIKPQVLSTSTLVSSIQNGTGNTAHDLVKQSSPPDNPKGPHPTLHMSTTSAYEADE